MKVETIPLRWIKNDIEGAKFAFGAGEFLQS